MESLESKLDRLSPEQRKEVEDFVDFLLSRSGNVPAPPAAGQTPVSFQNVAPPPLFVQEPAHHAESAPIEGNDSHLGEGFTKISSMMKNRYSQSRRLLSVVKTGSPTITWTTASLNKNHLQPLLR